MNDALMLTERGCLPGSVRFISAVDTESGTIQAVTKSEKKVVPSIRNVHRKGQLVIAKDIKEKPIYV